MVCSSQVSTCSSRVSRSLHGSPGSCRLPTLAPSCSKIGSARCGSLKSLRPAMLPVPDILSSRALGYISSNYYDLTAINRGFHASSYPARYYFVPSLNINWTAFAVNSVSHTGIAGGTAGPDVTVPTEQADFLLKHSSVLRPRRSSIFVYLHRTSERRLPCLVVVLALTSGTTL